MRIACRCSSESVMASQFAHEAGVTAGLVVAVGALVHDGAGMLERDADDDEPGEDGEGEAGHAQSQASQPLSSRMRSAISICSARLACHGWAAYSWPPYSGHQRCPIITPPL